MMEARHDAIDSHSDFRIGRNRPARDGRHAERSRTRIPAQKHQSAAVLRIPGLIDAEPGLATFVDDPGDARREVKEWQYRTPAGSEQ
jgi:hypothetical protein